MRLPRFTAIGAAAYAPGLDRMRRMLAAVGDPHRAVPAVHVAGTNGKGSTASLLSALLTASGVRTGLHTSPHLWHVGERMRIDGVRAPEPWLADAVGRCASLFARETPSFFEATVLLSFLRFAEAGAEAAVVEVGLGGRLDATNVLAPRAALVAEIALDHMDLLGETIGEIAGEKAGIFKPGVFLCTTRQVPEALAVLKAKAAAVGAPLHEADAEVRVDEADGALAFTTPAGRYDGVQMGLSGAHQVRNAALALRGAEAFLSGDPAGGRLGADAVRRAFADVARLAGLRARLETVGEHPRVVLDVAHNPHGIAASLAATVPGASGRRTVLLGLMRDKDAAEVARLVAASLSRVYPVPLPGERALPADELGALLRAAGADVGEPLGVREGVRRFRAAAGPDDVLLLTGSFLVAEAWGEGAGG